MAGGAWLAPPGSAQYRRLCSEGPSGRSGVHEVLAGTTRATPDTSTRVMMALPKASIVTGRLEGHGPSVEVESGGLGALGSVCVHRAAAQQRTVALASASGPFAVGFAADWPSSRPSVATQEMSGWWSLTTTTRVGWVQRAMLGGPIGPLRSAQSTCWHHQSDTGHLNWGHYGFAQGHHRHRPSRGPRLTCRDGGRRSGCPWLGLCASCRSTTAHWSTFQCVGGFAAVLATDWPWDWPS